MREISTVQTSIFDFYSKHELGVRLENLSEILDDHPVILTLLEADLRDDNCKLVGRNGLTIESVFRCLLLKQLLQVSYDKNEQNFFIGQNYYQIVRRFFVSYG